MNCLAIFSATAYDIEFFGPLKSDFSTIGLFLIFIPDRLHKVTAYLANNCKYVCVFVNDSVDAQTLAILKMNGCELILTRSVGYDHIDLSAAESMGMSVARVPKYSPHAIAEHALALILAANRHIVTSVNKVRRGNFCMEMDVLGFDIYGKIIGIIGTGTIGTIMAKILLSLGAEQILCYDKFINTELVGKYPNIKYVDLDLLLSSCDILTLHCPLSNETHHMLNANKLALMKNNAILLNTSRGGLIDTVALLECLRSDKFAAVALDVYEFEKGIFLANSSNNELKDSLLEDLLAFERVIITPHQAFFTKDALKSIADVTLFNVTEYVVEGKRGMELTNDVTKLAEKK